MKMNRFKRCLHSLKGSVVSSDTVKKLFSAVSTLILAIEAHWKAIAKIYTIDSIICVPFQNADNMLSIIATFVNTCVDIP